MENLAITIEKIGRDYEELKHGLTEQAKAVAKGEVASELEAMNLRISEAISANEEQKANTEAALAEQKKLSAIVAGRTQSNELEAAQRKSFVDAMRQMGKSNSQHLSFDTADNLEQLKKDFNGDIAPQGGVFIRPYLDTSLLVLQQELTPLRKYATVQTISTNSYIRILTEDNYGAEWTDDKSARANTQVNTFAEERIDTKNLAAVVPIAQNTLDDSAFDLQSFIMTSTARKFAYAEADAFFNGDGRARPRGILTYPAGNTWNTWEQFNSGSATGITYEALINLVYSLFSFYTPNAVFMAHRTTLAQLRLITYGDNFPVPMWQPSLQAGQPSTLAGFPVVYAPNMPVFATNALCLAFGDFSAGYKIIDRMGIQMIRDPYTEFPKVAFKFLKRVGGGQEDYRAIKLMKIATS